MKNQLKPGDTVIFDNVSRMFRSAAEGIDEYEELAIKKVQSIQLGHGKNKLITKKSIEKKEKKRSRRRLRDI